MCRKQMYLGFMTSESQIFFLRMAMYVPVRQVKPTVLGSEDTSTQSLMK